MKRLSMVLLVMVLVLSFAACGGDAPSDGAAENDDVSLTDAMDGTEQVDSQEAGEWPESLLHPDMPEYQEGELQGWSPWDSESEYNLFILIKDTNQADLDQYAEALEAAGFESVGDQRYRKGLYDVTLKMNSDAIAEISSYKTDAVEWPEALSEIPAIEGGDLSFSDGATEELPDSMNLYYINLPAENLKAWEQALKAKGFTGSSSSMKGKDVTFNGKTYSQGEIWYEENGTDEWNIYFEFYE